MDFLFALGQVVCIIGLLYGAYLSLTYFTHVARDALRADRSRGPAAGDHAPSEPNVDYDQLTSPIGTKPHSRLVANERAAARTLRAH